MRLATATHLPANERSNLFFVLSLNTNTTDNSHIVYADPNDAIDIETKHFDQTANHRLSANFGANKPIGSSETSFGYGPVPALRRHQQINPNEATAQSRPHSMSTGSTMTSTMDRRQRNNRQLILQQPSDEQQLDNQLYYLPTDPSQVNDKHQQHLHYDLSDPTSQLVNRTNNNNLSGRAGSTSDDSQQTNEMVSNGTPETGGSNNSNSNGNNSNDHFAVLDVLGANDRYNRY